MARFCPNCGTEETRERPLIEGLCQTCFTLEYPLLEVPKEIFLEACFNCASYKWKGKWVQPKAVKFNDVLQEAAILAVEKSIKLAKNAKKTRISIEPSFSEIARALRAKAIIPIKVKAYGVIHPAQKIPHEEEFEVDIIIDLVTCPKCSKAARKEYQAILQIRADERKLTDFENKTIKNLVTAEIEKFAKKGDPGAFISELEEKAEGLDFYLGSLHIAKYLVNSIQAKFGGKMKETSRQTGWDRNKGRKLYRTTVSIRLPAFRVKDFFEYRGAIHRIEELDGQKIIGLNLLTREKIFLPWKQIEREKIQLAAKREDVQSALVSAVTPDKLQILDPKTYQPIDVQRPKSLIGIKASKELSILKIDKTIYVVE
ncbi:MAG: NMD3-related protein [Euryarchaeota archaeon]|nr:NMD3-related protein [Euryarchaeota archaeon]